MTNIILYILLSVPDEQLNQKVEMTEIFDSVSICNFLNSVNPCI